MLTLRRCLPACPYPHLLRTAFLKMMAYRMRYVTGIATYAIFVGVQYFVWKAVYAAREMAPGEALAGLDFPTLVTYIAVGYIARAAYFNNLDSEIGSRFQTGEVVMDLLRPLDFHGNYIAQASGETLFRIVFFALPMSLVIGPIFDVQAPAPDAWWQFPLLFVAAFLINIELNLMAGTAAFFLEDITGLMSLKRNLIMLASGLLVPLHFLRELIGDWGVDLLAALPFALISYYPVLAYVGHLGVGDTPELPGILALAAIWLLVLRGGNLLLWAWARRRLEVQGG
jgi:ABC-2 type transport system permease protein